MANRNEEEPERAERVAGPEAPGEKERLDLILRLLDRSDERRASVTSRAGVVLSAAAILGTAISVLLGFSLSCDRLPLDIPELVVAGLLAVALLLALVTICFAATAVLNVWHTTRRMLHDFGEGPSRLFFHPRETLERFSCPDCFRTYLENTPAAELRKYAANHLWVMVREQHGRYQTLRTAARLLTSAVGVCAVALVLQFLFLVIGGK